MTFNNFMIIFLYNILSFSTSILRRFVYFITHLNSLRLIYYSLPLGHEEKLYNFLSFDEENFFSSFKLWIMNIFSFSTRENNNNNEAELQDLRQSYQNYYHSIDLEEQKNDEENSNERISSLESTSTSNFEFLYNILLFFICFMISTFILGFILSFVFTMKEFE